MITTSSAAAEEQRLAELLLDQVRWTAEKEAAGEDIAKYDEKIIRTMHKWMSSYDALRGAERDASIVRWGISQKTDFRVSGATTARLGGRGKGHGAEPKAGIVDSAAGGVATAESGQSSLW
jgi:hypothetical protein